MSSLPSIPGLGSGGSGLDSFMSLAQSMMGGMTSGGSSSSGPASPLQSLMGGGGGSSRQISPFDASGTGGPSSGMMLPFQSLLGGGGGGGGTPSSTGSPASGMMSPFQSLLGGGGGGGGTQSPSSTSSPTSGKGSNGQKSPTVQELSSAANSTYGIPDSSDLKPLEQNGKQVTETDQSGMVGKAYVTPQKQVIVAFGGTGSGGGSVLSGQIQADAEGGAGGVSPAQQDAAKFTQKVQGIAKQQGISSQNVFTTGHSLGGMEAQYASAQTGAGGMSFEAPGSTSGANAKGNGSNFVNVQDQSDPIANIGQHYGKTLSVNTGMGLLAHAPGAQNNQLPLSESLNNLLSSLKG